MKMYKIVLLFCSQLNTNCIIQSRFQTLKTVKGIDAPVVVDNTCRVAKYRPNVQPNYLKYILFFYIMLNVYCNFKYIITALVKKYAIYINTKLVKFSN